MRLSFILFCLAGTVACTSGTDTTYSTGASLGYNVGGAGAAMSSGVGANGAGGTSGCVAEICNGLDDDCDGIVDEGDNPCGGVCTLMSMPGEPCDGPDAGSCEEGSWSCDGLNALSCSDMTGDDIEICDNLVDENCDGFLDESCNGALEWAEHGPSTGWGGANDVAIADDGSIYIVGHFDGTAMFGAGLSLVSQNGGFSDGFVAKYDPTGAVSWVRQIGGTSHDYARAVAIAPDGSVLVAGEFCSGVGCSATFGIGDPNAVTLQALAYADIFVARYTSSGSFVAVTTAGSAYTDRAFGIASDAQSGFRVTGTYLGDNITFGLGQPNQTTLSAMGNYDYFVAAYDSSGTLNWARSAAITPYADIRGQSVAVSPTGETVVSGALACGFGCQPPVEATFGLGEPGMATYTTATGYGSFVARYDAGGALVAMSGQNGTVSARGVGIDPSDGAAIVTGAFHGIAQLGLGETNQTTLVSAGGEDIYLARYKPDGSLAWAKRAGSPSLCGFGATDEGLDVFVTPDGQSIVSGRFSGTPTFGLGEFGQHTLYGDGWGNVFVARFEVDGALEWARAGLIGKPVCDGGGAGNAVAVSPADGSIVVAGEMQGPITFESGMPNQTTLTGDNDFFLAKFTP